MDIQALGSTVFFSRDRAIHPFVDDVTDSGAIAPSVVYAGSVDEVVHPKLAVDQTHLYYFANPPGELRRVPLAGGAPETIAAMNVEPVIYLTSTRLFWFDGFVLKSRAK